MGCGCKTSGNKDIFDDTNSALSNKKLGQKIIIYGVKSLAFLLFIALLPLINLAILWFVFRILVINKKVDIVPLLVFLGKKFDPRSLETDEDDDDDFDSLSEDDVILLDTEDITNKVNNR